MKLLVYLDVTRYSFVDQFFQTLHPAEHNVVKRN